MPGSRRYTIFVYLVGFALASCARNNTTTTHADSESYGGSNQLITLMASAQQSVRAALLAIQANDISGFCDPTAVTDPAVDTVLAPVDADTTGAMKGALLSRLSGNVLNQYLQRSALATATVVPGTIVYNGHPVEALTKLGDLSAPIQYSGDLSTRTAAVLQMVNMHELGHQLSDFPQDDTLVSLAGHSVTVRQEFDMTGACIARAIAYRIALNLAPAAIPIYRLTDGQHYFYWPYTTTVNPVFVSQGVDVKMYTTPTANCSTPLFECSRTVNGSDFYLTSAGCSPGHVTITMLGYFCHTPQPGTVAAYAATTDVGAVYLTENVNEINAHLNQPPHSWFSYGTTGYFPQ